MQAMLLRREWIHGQGYTFLLSKLASPTDQSGGGTLIFSSTAREKKSSSSKEREQAQRRKAISLMDAHPANPKYLVCLLVDKLLVSEDSR